MEVILLGTGSPMPDAKRGGPATLVKAGATQILVDAGRAVVMRLTGAGSLPIFLSGVLITHLHSDHLTDLNDVITTHYIMSQAETPLHIYGPPRTQEVVNGILASLAPDISYRLAQVSVGQTNHAPVEPTVSYRIEHEGKSVVLGGDGIPCETLDAICKGADAYVQTVIRAELVGLVKNKRFLDILDYHSTVEQAAQTATRAGVKKLILTHYVPSIQPGQEEEWRALAAAHFAGEIVLGDDLTATTI
jgi:ribonuclease Z